MGPTKTEALRHQTLQSKVLLGLDSLPSLLGGKMRFSTSLTRGDWDERTSSWTCEVLSIPGASIASLHSGGKEIPRRSYSVDSGRILWNPKGTSPTELVAQVELTKDLSLLEKQKIGLEADKLDLERSKLETEVFWKKVAAVGAIIGFATPIAINHFFSKCPPCPPQPTEKVKILDQGNDFLSHNNELGSIGRALVATKREVWLYGSTFHITLDTYQDDLLSLLRRNVNLHFLVFDPLGGNLSLAAHLLNGKEDILSNQIKQTLQSLRKLQGRLGSDAPGRINVRLTRVPFTARAYLFDPSSPQGFTYFIPQIGRHNSQTLPGFLASNASVNYSDKFLNSISAAWNDATPLEDWLKAHSNFLNP